MTPVSNEPQLTDRIAKIIARNVDDERFYDAVAFQSAAKDVIAALRGQSPEPSYSEPVDWQCEFCRCKTFARVDERKSDGTFGPGPQVRCVNCKGVSTLSPTVSQPGTGEEVEWKTEASGLEVATIQHDDFSLLEVVKSRSPRHAFHLTIHRGSEDKGAWDDLSIDLTEGEALKLAAAVSDYQALKAELEGAYAYASESATSKLEKANNELFARLSAVEGALNRIRRLVTYPTDKSINPRGYGIRSIDISGSELIDEIVSEALTAALSAQERE